MGTEKINGGSALDKMPMVTYLILALCMAGAVFLSAKAYQGITERYQSGTDIRTAAQFACMKVRQSDAQGCLSDYDGRLMCHEMLDTGEEFIDMIYWRDGWLMELYQSSDAIFYGGIDDAGDKVIGCDSASFRLDGNGMASYDISVAGRDVSGRVFLRGGMSE